MTVSIVCIVSFVCGFVVYRIGLYDGQRVKDGGRIKPILKKKRTPNEKETKIVKGINNIISYANRKSKEMNNSEQIN